MFFGLIYNFPYEESILCEQERPINVNDDFGFMWFRLNDYFIDRVLLAVAFVRP